MAHEFSSGTVETLAGARTITAAEADVQTIWAFDCGGAARTLTLPAEATSVGYVLLIANASDGAEVLTIEDDGTNTVVTPTQNESCVVWCDGVAWHGLVGAES